MTGLATDLPALESKPMPPGPAIPAIAQTLLWSLVPTLVMDRWARRHGEIFTLTFAPSGRQIVVVSDPQAIKTLFTAAPEIAPSAAGSSPIAPIMGPNSVITLTGAEHMRQRKLLLPPFHGERMREYEQTITDATRAEMASWQPGEPMRLVQRTRSITLEVILRAVFGARAEHLDALRRAIADLLEPIGVLALLRYTLAGNQQQAPGGAIGRALQNLDRVIYDEIRRRRLEPDLHDRIDILSLLLLARDEDGQPMSDQELRDELVTLLLAGHETTATAVAWAIERLVRHPRTLEKLIAEVDAAEADDYMQAVISETMRVRPVVPHVLRLLEEPLRLCGHDLPAGTRIFASIYLTNRNERVYERAKEFVPERFLEDPPETFSWIPFGGGIRRCIGASFATLEMKVILRTILSELEPGLPARAGRLVRNGEFMRRRAITLVPAFGARVVWRQRVGERSAREPTQAVVSV